MSVLLSLSLLLAAVDVDGQQPVPDLATPVIEEVTYTSPRTYLYATYPSLARRLDCMIRLESEWVWAASGAGGRYIGLAQFDRLTWASTPQGQAGLSRTDPYASIDAMAWGVRNLGWGRWPISSRRC